MKLITFNWQPTDRQLRQFGAICLVALPAIGWFWGASTTIIGGLAVLGLVMSASGLVAPQALKPIFRLAILLAAPFGMVFGELAMLFIYFGVFLPIGILFRMTKRDALKLKRDSSRQSYWEPKSKPAKAASYYRQS